MCTAPGSVAYVAEEHADDRARGARLVGWAQALGDGVLQSHLGFVAVHPDHRRRGIGRLLVVATFQATRTKRMDLITDTAQAFYANFAHKRMAGSGSTRAPRRFSARTGTSPPRSCVEQSEQS